MKAYPVKFEIGDDVSNYAIVQANDECSAMVTIIGPVNHHSWKQVSDCISQSLLDMKLIGDDV